MALRSPEGLVAVKTESEKSPPLLKSVSVCQAPLILIWLLKNGCLSGRRGFLYFASSLASWSGLCLVADFNVIEIVESGAYEVDNCALGNVLYFKIALTLFLLFFSGSRGGWFEFCDFVTSP